MRYLWNLDHIGCITDRILTCMNTPKLQLFVESMLLIKLNEQMRKQLSHFLIILFPDGWGFSQLGTYPPGEGPGALKHQIIGTLHAATYMRGKICFNLLVALEMTMMLLELTFLDMKIYLENLCFLISWCSASYSN